MNRMSMWSRLLGGVTVLLLGISAPGAAVELVTIPIDGIVTGNEGESVLVAAVDVPSTFVGLTCQITGETDNQESVHINNDLLIVTGGQTIVIPNFEDEGFVVHNGSSIEAISETIEVFVRFGPDGVSSGGFKVDVNCDIEQPPTTGTTPPTTADPTTVTPTSEALPPSGPTVVDSIPSTTTPPVTDVPTTTAPPPLPPGTEPELPVTGSSTAQIGLFGVFVLCGGYVLRDWAKTRSIETDQQP
ncbi:MAG: hypothetical protein ACI8TP_003971 [Acidimicrobiales bacterium]|jgi:hypothetical protein